MTRDEVLDCCADLPGAYEDYPFGEEYAVFKVEGKMFALVMLDGEPGRVNLKCDPDWALELRAVHGAVGPGYHMNKRHWNTVVLDGSIDPDEVRDMVEHSYELVVAKLPRATRLRLGDMTDPTGRARRHDPMRSRGSTPSSAIRSR